jgi:hypothetical protein
MGGDLDPSNDSSPWRRLIRSRLGQAIAVAFVALCGIDNYYKQTSSVVDFLRDAREFGYAIYAKIAAPQEEHDSIETGSLKSEVVENCSADQSIATANRLLGTGVLRRERSPLIIGKQICDEGRLVQDPYFSDNERLWVVEITAAGGAVSIKSKSPWPNLLRRDRVRFRGTALALTNEEAIVVDAATVQRLPPVPPAPPKPAKSWWQQ